MDTYDVWKQENEWRVVREGDTRALRVFGTKREAVALARDFLNLHGGHLRIWKGEGDASSLQEERTYEAPHAAAEPEMVRRRAQGMFEGMMKGGMAAHASVGPVFFQGRVPGRLLHRLWRGVRCRDGAQPGPAAQSAGARHARRCRRGAARRWRGASGDADSDCRLTSPRMRVCRAASASAPLSALWQRLARG